MPARLLLASALLLAVGVAGCAVPAAESDCPGRFATPATFEAVYPPLVDGWEAIPLLEANGWILDPGEPPSGVLARASLRLGDSEVLRAVVADVHDESGVVGTSLRVEAPSASVYTDEAAALLLRPHAVVLEEAFAGRVGAPLEYSGYRGGEACRGI